MVSRLFLSPSLHSLLLLFSILMLAPIAYSEENKLYKECKKPFDCGVLRNLNYPFWRAGRSKYCGKEGFELICEDDQYPVMVSDSPDEFRLVKVDPDSKMMTINLINPGQYICPPYPANKTLNLSFLSQAGIDTGINLPSVALLYNCTNKDNMQYPIPIDGCEGWGDSYLAIDNWSRAINQYPWKQCESTIKFPASWPPNGHPGVDRIAKSDLQRFLEEEIDITYDYGEGAIKCPGCLSSHGVCGSRMNDSHFICLCSDKDSPDVCPPRGNDLNLGLKIFIGVAASLVTALILVVGFIIWYRRKKKRHAPTFVSKSITSDPSSKADIEIGGNYNGVHLFTYEELEAATHNFDSARELGEGGFGTVYYGQLYDGRTVAVKRLYENNYKRVGQFMNEVDILTRLRHPHLVSLYGCTSRNSRELLLVYEYVPNGTVADHLHGERAKPGALPWTVRMNIAVETASALAYLHKSDIIHRDVKTNNILLDNNYWVKVADFGLSRLFPTDVTHVSTAPQGTPGYVDPEYHECYQLTSKSDVYSFGVVLIELISSMPAVDITRHRQEINLSNMAINKIQRDALNELVDPNLGFESDYAVRKMVIAVAELAFRCLQWAKDMRPPMDEVVEALKEIQTAEYSMEKGENLDILSDNVGLLKSVQLQLSPDTVTTNWTSSSTTPSVSGKSLLDSGKEEILEITSDNVGLLRSTAPMQPSSGTVTTNTSTMPNASG